MTDPKVAIWGIVSMLSSGLSAYHGYKRNRSVGWAAMWGVMGAVFPIITPAVAVAQGFNWKVDPSTLYRDIDKGALAAERHGPSERIRVPTAEARRYGMPQSPQSPQLT